jgi:hypothetical protein
VSADPSPMKHPWPVRLGVPVLCGVAIDYGSDLFKLVTGYESTHLWFDLREGLFHLRDAWDLTLALAFCVTIIALGTLAVERWGDPRPGVKTALLIGSLTIIGVFFHPFAGR